MFALLFTALFIWKVNGASIYTGNWGGSGVFSGNTIYSNGASIAVSQINGKLEIYLDGKLINLDEANVVDEDDNVEVLSPVEVRGATITVDKHTGQVTVNYKGAYYRSLTSDMVDARLSHMLGGMEHRLSQMHHKLSNMLSNGFPFSY